MTTTPTDSDAIIVGARCAGAPSLLNEAPVYLALHDATIDLGDLRAGRSAIERAMPPLLRRVEGLRGSNYALAFLTLLPHNAGLLAAAEAYGLVPPEIEAVLHPAFPSCPGHELWKRDYTGACGLFGFSLTPGPPAAVNAFLDALELFGLGFSWGGFESLAISCDSQLKVRSFHPDYGGPLIRLHVGLEHPGDLIADLEQALAIYAAETGT